VGTFGGFPKIEAACPIPKFRPGRRSCGDAWQPCFTIPCCSYLLFISFFFYGWFWMHGGQTLGMRAWRLQIRNLRSGPINWWQVLLRFMLAIPSGFFFGLGYLWMLVDKRRLTWHDRYSETCVVQLERNPHSR
jgi:uncharacterized RDD family membrane protein YckC